MLILWVLFTLFLSKWWLNFFWIMCINSMGILVPLLVIEEPSFSANYGRSFFGCKVSTFSILQHTILRQMAKLRWSIAVWRVILGAWLVTSLTLGIIGFPLQNFGTTLATIPVFKCPLLRPSTAILLHYIFHTSQRILPFQR